MVSCCPCCSNNVETANHILINGPLARAIWMHFTTIFGIRVFDSESPTIRMLRLGRAFAKNSIVHILIRCLPLILYWELWKDRCRRKYDGKSFSFDFVINTIRSHLVAVADHCSFDIPTNQIQSSTLLLLNIQKGNPKLKKVRLIKWHPPPAGVLKLNIDGASKGNPGPSGGGSILRNDLGEVLFTTSNFYGYATNIVAECKAFLDGITTYRDMGLDPYKLIIESDSKLMVDCINGLCATPWCLWYLCAQIRSILSSLECSVRHTYREGNFAADFLASKGATGGDFCCSLEFLEQPVDLRFIVFYDHLQLGHLRL
ncbi:hypothetical protein L1049_000564 [Liquidambar formosana]|uniref:RNase H type-1 domain-containing protein n=1 Tax=Liquidambar formosana TaxID=63359 RepID=A0AAP0R4W1_LIQFO